MTTTISDSPYGETGRKDYPHVAQLVNGCLPSRLGSVRRSAYETLANVALFAKAHRVSCV